MDEEDGVYTGDPISLPASSTDLPIPNSSLLPLISLYKVLADRHKFAHLLFEDFVSAIAHKEQCSITSDIHVALLDDILSKELNSGKLFSTFEVLSMAQIDEVTWPSALRLYLKHSSEKDLHFTGDYYALDLEKRIEILLFLIKSHAEFSPEDPVLHGVTLLGTGSGGSKYWFTQRRLVVYQNEGVYYYSSKDKLDDVLLCLKNSTGDDAVMHDLIRKNYFDYNERMNETLVDFVFAHKTSVSKSVQSPTKYSGITYGEQSTSTLMRRDIESMPISSLLASYNAATSDSFTFGSDKLFLKYKGRHTSAKLTAAVSDRLREVGQSLKEQITWKSSSPDHIKLLKNAMLSFSSNISKHFMHDAWSKRAPAWENALLKAANSHQLAACLAFLESHIRPVLFKQDWITNMAEEEATSTPDTSSSQNEAAAEAEKTGETSVEVEMEDNTEPGDATTDSVQIEEAKPEEPADEGKTADTVESKESDSSPDETKVEGVLEAGESVVEDSKADEGIQGEESKDEESKEEESKTEENKVEESKTEEDKTAEEMNVDDGKEGTKKERGDEVKSPTEEEAKSEESAVKTSSKRKSPRQSLLITGEGYRQNSGLGWSYGSGTSPTKSAECDREKRCERLTRLVNKLQCTKGVNANAKRVISMPHGFKKTVGPDGKVMFALPPGAKILPQKGVTQVILSAKSLQTGGTPTTLQVIPSGKPMKPLSTPSLPTSVSTIGPQRNIVLSNEVVKGLLARTDLSVRGNVTLKRCVVSSQPASSATTLSDDPAQLIQRLFQSWPTAQGREVEEGNHSLPEHKKRKLGRSGGGVMLPGYLYSTDDTFCIPSFQNRWRSSLRNSQDAADIGVLVSMLHAHIRWPDLKSLEVLTANKYVCDQDTMVERIIVDSRVDKSNAMAKQFKIVVMKQKREGDDLMELPDKAIKRSMLDLDIGIHDIWVPENMVTFNEAYTYLFNQEKLKSIESARIMEEKKKNEVKVDSDSLLPRWNDGREDKPSDKYLVDSEISTVVRRVLTNILDRVEMEDMRDREKERIGKKRKSKKSTGRIPGRSTGEKEQIKYLSKLDILLGRRKEQLKKIFFKKRQYLAHVIREEIKFEEAESKRIADKIRREEEEELASRRKKNQEADRRKKDKEKKIRKAQDKIEKKLQRLQKNVDEMKTTGGVIKKRPVGRPPLKSPGRPSLKSPGRPSLKSPGRPALTKSTKIKKNTIRIDSHHVKPLYKNKLQPKTKFKFPPKRPGVKKSSAKLSLSSLGGRASTSSIDKFPDTSETLRIRLPSTEKPRDVEKILGKRKAKPGLPGGKRLCVEIKPVVLSKRKRETLEAQLRQYQRTIALSLTSDDISHPVIEMPYKKPALESPKRRGSLDKKRPTLKLKQKTTSSSVDRNTIRERLQKLRKIASAKNRGNEVLAKLLMKQELVKKLTAPPTGDKSSQDSDNEDSASSTVQPQEAGATTRPGVMQHHKDQTNKSAPKKKDTLYCICKRPYDHTRFYIGCDVCSNWFHGKCVAISPSMARNMSGYTCADCKAKSSSVAVAKPAKTEEGEGEEDVAAEPEGDLFCICRTPYNQYSFYIGCDSCQEWYHGTCVGISEMEAEKIEVYICDRCKQQQGREEPKLTHIQIAGLIKILRELQMHKMSWPFREPAKTDTELDVIKEPMDLSTIHKKFQKKHYPKLTLFVKDVLRVFSNARQLYSEDSQRGRCADTLERYFVAKLNEFKLRHGLS